MLTAKTVYFWVLLAVNSFFNVSEGSQQEVNSSEYSDPKQLEGPGHACQHLAAQRDRLAHGIRAEIVSQTYASHGPHLEAGLRSNTGHRRSTQEALWQPIRILMNYDLVGTGTERECTVAGMLVKIGEPAYSDGPLCSSRADSSGEGEFVSVTTSGGCWYSCQPDDVITDIKRGLLRDAIENAVDWFRSTLAVERVLGNLVLSGGATCGRDGGIEIPAAYSADGVPDADLVLMVTSHPTRGTAMAWAVNCEMDQYGRPIAGQVNVAPRYLAETKHEMLDKVLLHEVTHVLGFDPAAFSYYRNEARQLRSHVISTVFHSGLQRQVDVVVTPRVKLHSRQHFGIPDEEELSGLELEDGGGAGTAGSHWEARLMGNEIMT
eukprot:gene23170-28042_t